MRLLRLCCFPLLITWMGVALAQGEATRLAPWTLLDQFDRPYTLEPDLRVLLIREGSLLDKDSMKALEEDAREHGFVVLIERVGDGDKHGIVIEDGEIAS